MEKTSGALERAQADELRHQAGERLRANEPKSADVASVAEARALVHELPLNPIELEKENKALATANRELQAAQRRAEIYRDRYVDLYDHAPLGYVTLDEEGYIQEINLAGAAMLGRDRAELTGYEFAEHVTAADRAAFQEHVQQCCGERREMTTELGLTSSEGRPVTVQIHSIPIEADEHEGTFAKTAITDITERKRAEEAVREHARVAQAANESKSQFLANVSHELRTPMNAILGMIDVALSKARDSFVQDCLETARGSADLLLNLLNDLLDSARIEAGKLELKAAPFSLRRMLNQLTSVLAIQASEKELALTSRCPNELPDGFVGDRTRLQQVLFNLAGNALKFTERGEVQISVRGVDVRQEEGIAALEFAVRDTGIGIPPTEQQRLFRPFVQVDASTMRHFGGTGLGLSICKALVELMGGRIWLESEVGRGSTFYFIIALPLAGELPTEDEALSALPPRTVGPLRVLLAEDNLANQKLVDYVLRGRGHQVEMAGEGAEAVYLSERNSYDVILMDVQMPGMDGLEATAAIRRREREGRHVPIIAMTAHAMQSDCERCLAAGMDAYLVKPINGRELIGIVESLASEKPIGAKSKFDAAIPAAAHRAPGERTAVFDADKALERCFDSREMLDTMIQTFLAESDGLLSQMRRALENRDFSEVGRLGHSLKGTLVYLGAESAAEAASLVERFTPAAVEDAVDALEQRCLTLKAALRAHPLGANAAPGAAR